MEETTPRKRIDVAKPCCGRKRGHAPDCPSLARTAASEPEAPPPQLVRDMEAVAQAASDKPFVTQRVPERFTAGAFLDALLDDIADRIAARLRVPPRVTVQLDPNVVELSKAEPQEIRAHAAVAVTPEGKVVPVVEAEPVPDAPPAPPKPSKASQQTIEAEGRTVEREVIEAPDRSTHAEYVPPKPCKGCGVDTNIEGILHSKACNIAYPPKKEEPKPEPKPAAEKKAEPPKFEVLREAAVEYATKHSKEKLVALMEKYGAKGPEGVKLSLLPEDKRAEFYAELKA